MVCFTPAGLKAYGYFLSYSFGAFGYALPYEIADDYHVFYFTLQLLTMVLMALMRVRRFS